jgi:fructosamine-3-kinase
VARDDSESSWEQFAQDLAAAHRGSTGSRFGWHHDGYLGRLRQVNTWTSSGHEFFAEHRLLRYLSEPTVEQALTGADRRALERLCARLPEIVPDTDRGHRPGRLLHLGRSRPVHAVGDQDRRRSALLDP